MNTEEDSFVLLSAITPGSGKKRDPNAKPKYVKLTLKKNLEILIDTNLQKQIGQQLDTSSESESPQKNEIIDISTDEDIILISSDDSFQEASDRMSQLFPKLENDSLISEDLSDDLHPNISNDSNMSSDNIPMSNLSGNPTQTLDSYTMAQIQNNIETANDSSAELVNLKSDNSSDGNISRRESDIVDVLQYESSESPTDWVDVAPKFKFKQRTLSEGSNFEEIVHEKKMDDYNRCRRNVSPEGDSPKERVSDRLISAIMRAKAEKSSSESPPPKSDKPPKRTKKVRKVLVCNMFDVSDMSYEEEVEDEGTPEIIPETEELFTQSQNPSILAPETEESIPVVPKPSIVINDSQEYRNNLSILSSDRSTEKNLSLISSDASVKADFTDVADRLKRMTLEIPETDSEPEEIVPSETKTIDESIIEASSDEEPEFYKTAKTFSAIKQWNTPKPRTEPSICTPISSTSSSSVSMLHYPTTGDRYKVTKTPGHVHIESVKTKSAEKTPRNLEQTPKTIDKGAETLLDQLYGKGWRDSLKKKPVTEPRKPCNPKMVFSERKPKMDASTSSSVSFSHFSQKINQDMDSTRNLAAKPKKDSFIASDDSEDNNSPTIYRTENIFPKSLLTPRPIPKTPLLKKLTEICDNETSDSEASIQMEKLQLSESEQIKNSEATMEKLVLSDSETRVQSDLEDAIKELTPFADTFKIPTKTPKTNRRKLFCQKEFEEDNSALAHIDVDYDLTNFTYNTTGANQTDKELFYVDKIIMENEKKKERERLRILKQRLPISKTKTPKTGRKKKEDKLDVPSTSKKSIKKKTFDSDDDVILVDSDEDEDYVPSTSKKSTKKKVFDSDDDDILVDSTPKTRPTRKLNKFKSKLTPKDTSSDESVIESDVESLPESLGSDSEDDEETKAKDLQRRSIAGLSFLASLTANVHPANPEALKYKQNFKNLKEELAERLFKLYNETIFESKIPKDTTLEWSVRMRGTAGYCYNKRIIRAPGNEERFVRIVLSTKVIDQPSRLRDTLIHEMCHAATWIIDKVNDGHGLIWKSWARKAMRRFPELPPIRRCHDYEVATKYTYKCTSCGYSFGRQSKSLDLERKRCGYCWGTFEILLNKKAKDGTVKTVPTPKKVTGFAKYVQDNYKTFKAQKASENLKHCELMKLLGQQFKECKLKN